MSPVYVCKKCILDCVNCVYVLIHWFSPVCKLVTAYTYVHTFVPNYT